MFNKNEIIYIYNNYQNKLFNRKTYVFALIERNKKIIFITFGLLVIFINYSLKNKKNSLNEKLKEKIYFDKFEVEIFNKIKKRLYEAKCSEMWANQREFLNGIIRKHKPKKILEIGVRHGGSSIIILNAINDYKYSKLFSIDISSSKNTGNCLYQYFPEFIPKWKLYNGNIATEYMELIGGNIDMVLIDTAHFEPGEILDFLMVLPFLKEEAIVIFHDIANQMNEKAHRNEWAPYIIFNALRGEKYLPSGDRNKILKHDIGAVKLENNQNKYYHDYFRLLGGQWQYFPRVKHINQLIKYFSKYYDNDCLIMFNETIEFNRQFVKNNPKNIIYAENIDKVK